MISLFFSEGNRKINRAKKNVLNLGSGNFWKCEGSKMLNHAEKLNFKFAELMKSKTLNLRIFWQMK